MKRSVSLAKPASDTALPITIVLGTRAQLIKMAPVMRELERRARPFRLVLTGQHKATMQTLLAEFEIATRPETVYGGSEISGVAAMLVWFPMILWRLLRHPSLSRDDRGTRALVVVHGDTFSTLVGALAGKLRGCLVAHVESGLRSFNAFNPFPEELTRVLVFRLTDIAFCPGAWAAGNMAKYRARVIDTGHNTLLDALRFAVAADDTADAAEQSARYCVASVHRFENIFIRRRIEWIAETVERIAERFEVVFVLHPATEKRLRAVGLFDRLDANPRVHFRERMPYTTFIRLLRGARFVMTDGGSNQEELHYMRKPTLLLRNATERKEGLEDVAVLCKFSASTVDEFLHKLAAEGTEQSLLDSDVRPSRRIVDGFEGGLVGAAIG